MMSCDQVFFHAICAFLNGCEFRVKYGRDEEFKKLKGFSTDEMKHSPLHYAVRPANFEVDLENTVSELLKCFRGRKFRIPNTNREKIAAEKKQEEE